MWVALDSGCVVSLVWGSPTKEMAHPASCTYMSSFALLQRDQRDGMWVASDSGCVISLVPLFVCGSMAVGFSP